MNTAWLYRPLWVISAALYGLVLAWSVPDALFYNWDFNASIFHNAQPALVLIGLALYLLLLLYHVAHSSIAGLALAALIASNLWFCIVSLGFPFDWLPLLISLWQALLFIVWRNYGAHSPQLWQPTLYNALIILPIFGLTLLVLLPNLHGLMCAITLLLLAITATQVAFQQAALGWGKAAFWLGLAGLSALWFWNTSLSWTIFLALTPWYAWQNTLILLALTAREAQLARLPLVPAVYAATRIWLVIGTLLLLVLHSGALWVAHSIGGRSTLWFFSPAIDATAAITSLLILALWSAWYAWRKTDATCWSYLALLLCALLLCYLRLLLWGLTPFTPWDTAVLLIISSALFLVYQFTNALLCYRLAFWTPLLALCTVPWQWASSWCGATLLAMSVLYLSLSGAMRNPLPLYLGVLALNGAIYLWIPVWGGSLWQFYLLPGAISVLVLLHLHRHELRPSVLSGGRLAALSLLYAGGGLDIFLQPAFSVFVLAIGLALLGIVLGIALRIRAFLYTAVTFLILNISGQLLRLYPEQGMSRALLLIVLGVVITGAMVLFNLKREALLQRVRIMRADLSDWE